MQTMQEERTLTGVVHYAVTTTKIDTVEPMRYTTYGIQATAKDGTILAQYPDISTNRTQVEQIVERCNKHQADILHLEDIILDALG